MPTAAKRWPAAARLMGTDGVCHCVQSMKSTRTSLESMHAYASSDGTIVRIPDARLQVKNDLEERASSNSLQRMQRRAFAASVERRRGSTGRARRRQV